MTDKLFRYFTGILFILSIFVLCTALLYNVRLILTNSPLELRENSFLLTTNLLLAGKNPFGLENMPVYTNIYGILYSLVVLPFAAVFGSTFFVHRIVSLFFILAICYVLYKILREANTPGWIAIVPCTFFYAQMVLEGSGNISTRPNSLGLFLFILSIYSAKKFNFSNLGLAISLIISLLGFLTKPYFILGFPFLALYLFMFVSKKKGFIFAFTGTLFFSLSFFIIQSIFETYFFNTIIVNYQLATISLSHLLLQTENYFSWNFAVFLLLAFYLIFFFKNKIKVDIFLFALIFFSMIFFLKFGMHKGTYMNYFTQLVFPFLLIVVFRYMHKEKTCIKLVFASLLIVNLLFWSYRLVGANADLQTNELREEKWIQLIQGYQHVYATSLFSDILYSMNRPVYDTGQSENFAYGLAINRKIHLIPGADEQYQKYKKHVEDQIIQKKFNLVMLLANSTSIDSPYFTKEELVRNYQIIRVEPYHLYDGDWMIGIWTPRSEN